VEVLDADLAQVRIKLAEMMAVMNHRLLAKPTLVAQIGEKSRHTIGKGLVGDAVMGVAHKSGHDQSQHVLDGPTDLASQTRSRRSWRAPVIGSSDPAFHKRIDVRWEILVRRGASRLRECPEVHQHRHTPRQILGGVAALDQPRGVLLDGRAEPG
jgi:hypothetical protein